jgi:hypothetical protein
VLREQQVVPEPPVQSERLVQPEPPVLEVQLEPLVQQAYWQNLLSAQNPQS